MEQYDFYELRAGHYEMWGLVEANKDLLDACEGRTILPHSINVRPGLVRFVDLTRVFELDAENDKSNSEALEGCGNQKIPARMWNLMRAMVRHSTVGIDL